MHGFVGEAGRRLPDLSQRIAIAQLPTPNTQSQRPMTNQPQDLENRLIRLEALFANAAEQVVAHHKTIDVLVANVQQLTNHIDVLVMQAAADRAQAAADRQQAAIERQDFNRQMEQRQREIRSCLGVYLRDLATPDTQ